MGEIRRYDMLGEGMARRAAAEERQGKPIGLSEPELRATGRRQDARQPIPVRAWVRHRVVYEESVEVEGAAVAWTNDAVLVRYTPPGERHERHVWVWASAVNRRE